MDKLKAMHAFLRIADEGSLTAATRTLDRSLPAVVRSLGSLESHLRVRPFNGTTRRISLTEEGRRYPENRRKLLTAAEDAETALKTEAAEPAGKLSITAPV